MVHHCESPPYSTPTPLSPHPSSLSSTLNLITSYYRYRQLNFSVTLNSLRWYTIVYRQLLNSPHLPLLFPPPSPQITCSYRYRQLHFSVSLGNRRWYTVVNRHHTRRLVALRSPAVFYLSWHADYGVSVYSQDRRLSASWVSIEDSPSGGNCLHDLVTLGAATGVKTTSGDGGEEPTYASHLDVVQFWHVDVCWRIVLYERQIYATLTTTQAPTTQGLWSFRRPNLLP